MTLNFHPIDDTFDTSDADLEAHFEFFEWSRHPGHFHQRRAWKRTSDRVSLAASAGHDVAFPGRRVFPYKFLLKHYPIRSSTHGARKVFEERKARFDTAERALGWHQQYDELVASSFLHEPSTLIRFEPATFSERWLLERLSAVGVFDVPPDYATPPHWG